MTMVISSFNIALFGLCLYFSLVISESTDCQCSGPVAYYKNLGCTPVFKNNGDCCAERYNCDKLKNLPRDKCFINDHYYDIGKKLKEEDSNPCDIDCTCRKGFGGIADFTCAVVDCFQGPPKPGCYRKNSPLECCPGEETCPENPEERATCNVNGKIYKEGEYFEAPGEPDKSCNCMPGYTGKNIEPFCASPKHPYCGIMRRRYDIDKNCAPVYYSSQSPQTDCSVSSRCQNNNDMIIARNTDSSNMSKSETSDTVNPDMTCTFGNLTMQIGDELNQATDYSSVCVKCVCEVPPLPTCQRLPDEECDVTKHPKFENFEN